MLQFNFRIICVKYIIFLGQFLNYTAEKAIFPEPWHSMESSKTLSKYHLSINLLAQKWPNISSPKSSKQERFSTKQQLISNQ